MGTAMLITSMRQLQVVIGVHCLKLIIILNCKLIIVFAIALAL